MVLESANCVECKSEVWHDDNYCQECGVKTPLSSQRDTSWRKVPTGPSWIREDREPIQPTWLKPQENINQPAKEIEEKPVINKPTQNWSNPEPTPIRSFVQSVPSKPITESAPMPEQVKEVVPPPPPPPPPLPPVSVVPPAPPTPVVEPKVVKETKVESVKVTPLPEIPKSVELPLVEDKVDDSILKAKWTALESPLLRPRMADELEKKKPAEEIVHKIKITNILWLCVCFLAGILIYCLFDIVKMTILKPETNNVKQQVVVPPSAVEPKPQPTPPEAVETPVVETPVVQPQSVETPENTMPVKAVSVHTPAAVKPVSKPVATKPLVKPVATTKVQPVRPKAVVPAKPAWKPRVQPLIAPEVVQSKATNDAGSSRTRTVWQAPATAVKAPPAATPAKPSHVVTSKGTGGDLARYNRLLADYFSRAGNGSFGDEASEPPTYSEWLGRGKPEF